MSDTPTQLVISISKVKNDMYVASVRLASINDPMMTVRPGRNVRGFHESLDAAISASIYQAQVIYTESFVRGQTQITITFTPAPSRTKPA